MKDFSIRIPASESTHQIILEISISEKNLPKLKDYYFKPKDVPLKNYRPDDICIRLREFTDSDKPSELSEIKTTKSDIGYKDEKKSLGTGDTAELIQKATELGYELWGEVSFISTEYKLGLENGHEADALYQQLIPIGQFIKIEAQTEEDLVSVLNKLQASEQDRVDKNAAVLLGELMGLI